MHDSIETYIGARKDKCVKNELDVAQDLGAQEEGTNPEFKPVNLLDSDDEDLDNVAVDDVPSGSDSDSGSNSESEIDTARTKLAAKKRANIAITTDLGGAMG